MRHRFRSRSNLSRRSWRFRWRYRRHRARDSRYRSPRNLRRLHCSRLCPHRWRRNFDPMRCQGRQPQGFLRRKQPNPHHTLPQGSLQSSRLRRPAHSRLHFHRIRIAPAPASVRRSGRGPMPPSPRQTKQSAEDIACLPPDFPIRHPHQPAGEQSSHSQACLIRPKPTRMATKT
jgi:hypothetical protein